MGANGNGVILYPPDYGHPERMRLGAANGYILFDYLDTNGDAATLAYREANQSWWPWQYNLGTPVPPVDLGVVTDEHIYWTYQWFTPEAVAVGGTPGLGAPVAVAGWDFKPNPGALWSPDSRFGALTPKASVDLFGHLITGWTNDYRDLGIPDTPANAALFANYTDPAAAQALFKQIHLYFFVNSQYTTPNVPATEFRSYANFFQVYLDLNLSGGSTIRLWPSTISATDFGGLGSGGGTANLANLADRDPNTFAQVYRDTYAAGSSFTNADKYGWEIVCTDWVP